jgi:hypothetical protein
VALPVRFPRPSRVRGYAADCLSYRSRARPCLCLSDGNSYRPGLVPLFPSLTTLLIRMDVHPFHVHSFLNVRESLTGQPPAAFSRRISRALTGRPLAGKCLVTCITSVRHPGDPGITRRASHQHNPAIRNDPSGMAGYLATTSASTAPAISTAPTCFQIINGLTVSNQGCLRFAATRSLASKDVTARYRRGPLRVIVKACRGVLTGGLLPPGIPESIYGDGSKAAPPEPAQPGPAHSSGKDWQTWQITAWTARVIRAGSAAQRSRPRCAGNHIEHIYIKTGCPGRAEASLDAMQQGLLATCARRKDKGKTPRGK